MEVPSDDIDRFRDALEAARLADPAMIAKIADAIASAKNGSDVTGAAESFLDAAKSVIASDPVAARTLFTVAELLAAVASRRASTRLEP